MPFGGYSGAHRGLAVAHAAYFLAARADLFSGSVVRASDGALYFYSDGLDIERCNDGYRFDNIAAAASLPGRFRYMGNHQA